LIFSRFLDNFRIGPNAAKVGKKKQVLGGKKFKFLARETVILSKAIPQQNFLTRQGKKVYRGHPQKGSLITLITKVNQPTRKPSQKL